jgi:hypothetical protein
VRLRFSKPGGVTDPSGTMKGSSALTSSIEISADRASAPDSA